jgi:predicted MFS family arabinose efflux permease
MMMDEEGSVTQKDKMEIKSQISQRLSLISNRQYGWNIVILTIFWTASSFSFYLLMFMNKYYEGSLYVNYYLDGVAGILGSCFSSAFYNCIKMRWSFIISVSITFVGAILLLVYQQGYGSPVWFGAFLPADKQSPYPEGSH